MALRETPDLKVGGSTPFVLITFFLSIIFFLGGETFFFFKMFLLFFFLLFLGKSQKILICFNPKSQINITFIDKHLNIAPNIAFELSQSGFPVTIGNYIPSQYNYVSYIIYSNQKCPNSFRPTQLLNNFIPTQNLIDVFPLLILAKYIIFLSFILSLLLLFANRTYINQTVLKTPFTQVFVDSFAKLQKNQVIDHYSNKIMKTKKIINVPISNKTIISVIWDYFINYKKKLNTIDIPLSLFNTDEDEKSIPFLLNVRPDDNINNSNLDNNENSPCRTMFSFEALDNKIIAKPDIPEHNIPIGGIPVSSVYTHITAFSRRVMLIKNYEDLLKTIRRFQVSCGSDAQVFATITNQVIDIKILDGTDSEKILLRNFVDYIMNNKKTQRHLDSQTIGDKRMWGGAMTFGDETIVLGFLRSNKSSIVRGPDQNSIILSLQLISTHYKLFTVSPKERFNKVWDFSKKEKNKWDVLDSYARIAKNGIIGIINENQKPLLQIHEKQTMQLIKMVPKAILQRKNNCELSVAGRFNYSLRFYKNIGIILLSADKIQPDLPFISAFPEEETIIWILCAQNLDVYFTTSSLFDSFTSITNSINELDLPNVTAAIDHVKQFRDVSLTIDVRMKVHDDNQYRTYSFYISCSCSEYLNIVAISSDSRIQKTKELRDIEKTVSIALSSGRVSVWSYQNVDSPMRVYSQWPDPRTTALANRTTVQFNIPNEYQDLVFNNFEKCLRSGQPFCIDVPVMMNTVRWFSFRGVRESPDTVTLLNIDITAMKVAEEHLRFEKARFEEATTAKTRFLANMSHEIRNPLNGMSGLLELLLSTDVVEKYSHDTEILSDSFQKLLELLNDTLDLAKIEQNQMHPSFANFDPLQVLSDTLFKQKKQAVRNGIKIISRISPDLPYVVYGDPHIFARIASNLASNAVKFTKEGSIIIQLAPNDDDSIELVVQDTGIGISPTEQKKIFEIFSQGDSSITRAYGGVGVGLALINKMLSMIHGDIKLQSEVGYGSTFSVRFPYQAILVPFVPATLKAKHLQVLNLGGSQVTKAIQPHCYFSGLEIITEPREVTDKLILIYIHDSESQIQIAKNLKKMHPDCTVFLVTESLRQPMDQHEQNEMKEKLKKDIPGIEIHSSPLGFNIIPRLFAGLIWKKKSDKSASKTLKLKVLLAEDNATNQLVMRKIFEKLGIEATIVDNGALAVAALPKQNYNLVILDQHMPVMDGPSAARAIRASNEKWSTIPIVALTASHSKEEENACLSAGMNAFLCKPITIKMLTELLRKYAN